MTLLDEISLESICLLEIDGTQTMSWNSIIAEEALLLLLHVRKTSEGLKVGIDVALYPSVPSDWYHGPSDWKEIDVSFLGDEPKLIKVGSHLEGEELEGYRSLIMEYRDVFVWSYLDLLGVPPPTLLNTPFQYFQMSSQFDNDNNE